MTSPAASPQPVTGFPRLLDDAAVELAVFRRTAEHALKTGVIPSEIVAYVQADLGEVRHRQVQAMIAGSEWALGRVAALVKARRDPGSLGSRILAARPLAPSDFGIAESGDPDADLATLLDQV